MEANKMESAMNVMFILGAGGFVGQRVVKEALASGWKVKALARSANSAQQLAATGAEIVYGSADNSRDWAAHLRDARVVVDLLQPKIPSRLTRKTIGEVSQERQRLTLELLGILDQLPKQERPLLISVSGIDDFNPDQHNRVTSYTPIRSDLVGFAHIGVPVRRLVEKSSVDATFVYLASVYGPGKTFADIIIPRIANGRWRVLGDGRNRMPLVHVEDAARALVHIAGLQRADVSQKNFVVADCNPVSAREFYEHTAQLIGAKRPGRAPRWLGSLIAGRIIVETMTRDLVVDCTELRKSGFEFKYPSHRDGLPPTLEALGYRPQPRAEGLQAKDWLGFIRKNLAFALLTIVTFGTLAAENLERFTA
jgi:nucleoside-diphosphate-sugar epimerase